MQRIINFIIRYKTTLLYFFLLFISLAFTIRSHSFHHAVYFNSANRISGSIFNTSYSIRSYFNLKEENDKLHEENRRLRNLLFNKEEDTTILLDTTGLRFTVERAQVIKNSYASPNNYITINKGSNDSIVQDIGVITTLGILGIVEKSSNNYALVQSILNTKSIINAKIKDTDNFGSLTWDTKNYQIVQLQDIPRAVPLQVGDTIVTGAMSSIFPENIPIGTILEFNLTESQSFYSIDVRLFNDMTNLDHVYLIKNQQREEILELESEIGDDQ